MCIRDSYKCFMQFHKKLPKDTPKCAAWKDAYKGAGSYYTLLNLVRFHGCGIYADEYAFTLKGDVYKRQMHGWFWQSNKDKDLVILKEWIND